jgi:hypothetical protein
VSEEAVTEALDPAQSVDSRDSQGGPAPESVEATIADARETLAVDSQRLVDARERLDAAESDLASEVDDYV